MASCTPSVTGILQPTLGTPPLLTSPVALPGKLDAIALFSNSSFCSAVNAQVGPDSIPEEQANPMDAFLSTAYAQTDQESGP